MLPSRMCLEGLVRKREWVLSRVREWEERKCLGMFPNNSPRLIHKLVSLKAFMSTTRVPVTTKLNPRTAPRKWKAARSLPTSRQTPHKLILHVTASIGEGKERRKTLVWWLFKLKILSNAMWSRKKRRRKGTDWEKLNEGFFCSPHFHLLYVLKGNHRASS